MLQRIKRWWPIVRYYQRRYPSESTCSCCGLPWSANGGGHDLQIKDTNMGFFVCCDYCWERMSLLDRRLEAEHLYHYWRRRGWEPEFSLEEMLEAVVREWHKS